MIWPWVVGSVVLGFLFAGGGKGEVLPADLASQVTQARATPGAFGHVGLMALSQQLQVRGFPKTSSAIAELARQFSPPAAQPAQQTQQATGMPKDLSDLYVLAKSNPTVTPTQTLIDIAARLKAAGFAKEATEVLELAAAREVVKSPAATPEQKADAAATVLVAAAQTAPAATPAPAGAPPFVPPQVSQVFTSEPTKAPTVQLPPQFTPPIQTAVQLSLAATKANQLSSHLNALVKARGGVAGAKGREDATLVLDFQRAAGIGADGKYGPGSAKTLARYNGDIPLVFYWPKGTLPNTAVPQYRRDLTALADEAKATGDLERAMKILLSAAREQGQGFGTYTQKVTAADPPDVQKASVTLQNYLALSSGQALSGLAQLDAVLQQAGKYLPAT